MNYQELAISMFFGRFSAFPKKKANISHQTGVLRLQIQRKLVGMLIDEDIAKEIGSGRTAPVRAQWSSWQLRLNILAIQPRYIEISQEATSVFETQPANCLIGALKKCLVFVIDLGQVLVVVRYVVVFGFQIDSNMQESPCKYTKSS